MQGINDIYQHFKDSYFYLERNRKHYKLKDADLPKGEYVRGNETTDLWRRLEKQDKYCNYRKCKALILER